MADVLTVEARGSIRVVTLNRPDELNAVDASLHVRLGEIWHELELDPEAKAVLITGAGRAFSAGGDFDFMMASQTLEGRTRNIEEARRIVGEMVRFPLPVVCAVNGPAVGLGCSLAVLSDIVFISDKAFMADPHVLIGVVPGDGGAAVWPSHMSLLRAKEFLMTGDRISPALAVELGLANRVVPHDELFDTAFAMAERLAGVPAQALRDTKRALNMHLEKAMSGVAEFALAAEREGLGGPDHASFLDGQRARREARA